MADEKDETWDYIDPLLPIVDREAYKNITGALNAAIKKGCINIGLVGPYGCGKSSAIKTFLDERNDLADRTVYVSFGDYLREKDSARFTKEAVERSILEQILFSREPSKTDGSRIKRARDKKTSKLLSFGISFIALGAIMLLSLICFLNNDKETFEAFFRFDFISVPIGVVVLAILGTLLFVEGLVMVLCGANEFHFKVKDVEIDCVSKDEETGDSILDKYFDEIRYFCDKNEIRIIVCEDIDRLGDLSNGLFVDLRHLSVCLNESHGIKGHRSLSFVYCTNDCAFKKDGEMQKFFDCIIPITPILNFANRVSVIQEKLSSVEDLKECAKDSDFVWLFANYVSDMRVLISTINEYKIERSPIYKGGERSKTTNTKREKEQQMLLCLYHNSNPDKYEELFTENSEYKKVKAASEIAMKAYKDSRESLLKKLLGAKQTNEMIPLSSEQIQTIRGAIYSCRGRSENWFSSVSDVKNCVDAGVVESFGDPGIMLWTKDFRNSGLYLGASVSSLEKVIGRSLYEWIEEPFRKTRLSADEEIQALEKEIQMLDDPLWFAMNYPAEVFSSAKVTSLMKAMIVNGFFNDATMDSFLCEGDRDVPGSLAYVRRAIIEKDVDLTLVHLTNVRAVIDELDTNHFSDKELINADLLNEFLRNGKNNTPDNVYSEKKRRILKKVESSDPTIAEKRRRLISASLPEHKDLICWMLEKFGDWLSSCVKNGLSDSQKSDVQQIVILSATNKKYAQKDLPDVIRSVWSGPISESDVRALSNIREDFGNSGFKYADISFAIGHPSIMSFITTTNCWKDNETNFRSILGCGNSELLDVKDKLKDEKWCADNGINGEKVAEYIKNSRVLSALIRTQRRRFNFIEAGIQPGEKVVFTQKPDADIFVAADGKRVVYEDKLYSLSKLRGEVFRIGGNEGVLSQFTYKGVKLADIPDGRTESDIDFEDTEDDEEGENSSS